MNDIFDEYGFSKINSIGTLHSFDPETKVYTSTFEYPLIKGSSLPANATMIEPIENPKGVNRWDGEKWFDDLEYGNKLLIEDRKVMIIEIQNSLHERLTKLTLKQSVGRTTPTEDELRIKIINYFIDLEEFPVDDLSKDIPILNL